MSEYTEPTNLSELYVTLTKGIEELQTQAQIEAQKMLKTAFSSFFDKYGNYIDKVYWLQYTPYFSDGDENTFSVNDVYAIPKILGEAADEDEYEEYTPSSTISSLLDAVNRVKDELDWVNNPTKFVKDKFATHGNRYFGYRFKDANLDAILATWELPIYEDNKTELVAALEMHINCPDIEEDFNKLSSFIHSINEEYLKMAYGDHVKVIVTSDDVYTEEYDHD